MTARQHDSTQSNTRASHSASAPAVCSHAEPMCMDNTLPQALQIHGGHRTSNVEHLMDKAQFLALCNPTTKRLIFYTCLAYKPYVSTLVSTGFYCITPPSKRTGEPSAEWLLDARWKNNARIRHFPFSFRFRFPTFIPFSTLRPHLRAYGLPETRKGRARAQPKAAIRCMTSMRSANENNHGSFRTRNFHRQYMRRSSRLPCRSLALVQSVIHTKK